MSTRTARRAHRGIVVAGIAALMTLVAACGTSGPKSGGAGAGSGGAVVWALTNGDVKAYQQSAADWNKAHPDRKINLQLFQNDPYKQKLRVAIGAGNPPAVFFNWGGGILKSYVDAGNVADLTDELNKDPAWKGRFLPSVMKSVTFDGKVYGIPANSMQPVLLYYNKKVFADAGAQPPRTFDDLLALIPRFKAKGIAPLALGGSSKWPDLMYEEYLVDRIGGAQVFADIEAGKPGAWSNPAVLKANQMIQQLVDAGAFVKGFSSIAYDTGQASALLYTGKAAMHLMGTWDFPNMLNAQPDFVNKGTLGWTTFPTVAGGKGDPRDVAGNPANFYSVAAKASAADKAVAIDYLKNGVLNDAYVDTLLKGGGVAPVQGLAAKLGTADHSDWLTFVYDLARNAPTYQLSWDQALPPTQADALLTNLDRLFLKQITPQQFSDNMNKAAKQ